MIFFTQTLSRSALLKLLSRFFRFNNLTVSTSRTITFVLLFSSQAFPQTHFKFAWLSDTHVGSATGEADLRRSVADINAMNDIAFVIHSGDVTEFGSDVQLHIAQRLFDSLNKPHYICPGNHDTKWSESGCTTFPKLFGNDKFVFEFGKFRFIGLHQGPRMRMGDGHWAPEDMRWLDSVLAAMPDKNQPLFFVTHYPVDSSISNWFVMLDKVKKYNTQAILHGHGHRNGVFNFEGIAGIMSRSNLRARDSVGGYTIAEVRNDTLFVSERTPGIRTSKPWHYILLGDKNYSKDTIQYYRPDYTINSHYPDVKVKWKFNSGYTITSTPAVHGDSVLFGDASGAFHCISLADGRPSWSFRTRGPIYSSPCVTQGRVMFGSSDSNLYCLDVATGKELWKVKTGAAIVSSPAVHTFSASSLMKPPSKLSAPKPSDNVYFGGSDRTFRAVDITNGKEVWRFSNIAGFVETKPLLYERKIYFGAWDSYLYALNEKDGSLAWKWRGDSAGVLYSPAACIPVGVQGRIFIAAPDRMLTALDTANGKEIWRSGMFQVRESIGKTSSPQEYKFYIRTLRDSILALSSYTNAPDVRWATNVGFGYDHNYAALVEKDGTLFYGTRNGLLIALNARDGKVKWQYKTGVALLNTVAPIDRRRVVVSNVDGGVMLIEADE